MWPGSGRLNRLMTTTATGGAQIGVEQPLVVFKSAGYPPKWE